MKPHRFSQNGPITIHVALQSAHTKCYTTTNGEQQTINRKLDNTCLRLWKFRSDFLHTDKLPCHRVTA